MELEYLLEFGNNMYFFFLAYTILGAGLKFIDDAFDEKIFNKKIAIILGPFFGIFGAYTMLVNPVSATILLAVVLGVLLKGKIDNIAHLITFFSFFMIFILINIVNIMILPLIFLAAAAILDEVGNDVIDYNKSFKKKKRFKYQFAIYFFGRRYMMKVALLYLVILNVIPIYFLIAFILFDESYIIVSLYSKSRKTVASKA